MSMKLQVTPRFPALVVAGPGIQIGRSNGVYTITATGGGGGGGGAVVITNITTTPYMVDNTETYLFVSVAGPAMISLPPASGRLGLPIVIKDTSGAASANPISISTAGGETIDGLTPITINSNYGGFHLIPKPIGGWVISP